jgi:hypothetical protein
MNYFWGNLFCKKTFFRCKFVITGFNTGRGKRGYKVVAQGISLRIVGYNNNNNNNNNNNFYFYSFY